MTVKELNETKLGDKFLFDNYDGDSLFFENGDILEVVKVETDGLTGCQYIKVFTERLGLERQPIIKATSASLRFMTKIHSNSVSPEAEQEWENC